MNTVMVVEDEPEILELVELNLRHAGFKPYGFTSALKAQAAVAELSPQLIVLDWMLPGKSGVQWLRELKADPTLKAVPVILLTARAQEGDRLLGFEAGADDYVTKPFSGRELVARVKAVLRRAQPDTDPSAKTVGRLRLDTVSHRAQCESASREPVTLDLTQTEFRLLAFFMRHPDTALNRERILSAVWRDDLSVDERTVDAQVRRLRLALKAADADELIETVRGEGYRLKP